MTRPEAPELCPRCGEPIVQLPLGRRRKWCSDYCRRRADEEGLKVHEVVRERERVVYRPERVSREQQIARLLDDPEATEQLLRALAYRWRHTAPDPAARQQIAPGRKGVGDYPSALGSRASERSSCGSTTAGTPFRPPC
ncbi:hypothetical protein [Nocardia farcinica]|uniref:hypothetical protein n=1 Tax=Nocardia farcinica TaxID=37329 RepID=UPI001E5435E6|nr:hypothetical protein [Nocardia farcinica]